MSAPAVITPCVLIFWHPGRVVRFPPRSSAAIWVVREDQAWLVIAGAHGWLAGSREQAIEEAQWLSRNLGLPVRDAHG
jgi:hypothetical protein